MNEWTEEEQAALPDRPWELLAVALAIPFVLVASLLLSLFGIEEAGVATMVMLGSLGAQGVALVVVLAVAKVQSRKSVLEAIGLDSPPDFGPLRWAVPAMILGNMALGALSEAVMKALALEVDESPVVEWIRSGSVGDILALWVAAVVIAPLCEEVFFRHALFEGACRMLPRAAATVLTACLFALTHGLMVGFLSLFCIGLILQKLRDDSNLATAITAHMFYNQVMICIGLIAIRYGEAM